MDIQLEKKKGIRAKHLPFIIGGTLLLGLIGWMIFGNHQSTFRMDSEDIVFYPVKQETFNDFIRVDGQVQPDRKSGV